MRSLLRFPANAEDSSRRGPRRPIPTPATALPAATLAKKPVERNRFPGRFGLWAFEPVPNGGGDDANLVADSDIGRSGVSGVG